MSDTAREAEERYLAPEDVRDELANVVDVALDEWACRGTNGLGTPSYRIADAIRAVFDVRKRDVGD